MQAEGLRLRSQPDAQAQTDGKLSAPPNILHSLPQGSLGGPSQEGSGPGPGGTARGSPWAGPCRWTVAGCAVFAGQTRQRRFRVQSKQNDSPEQTARPPLPFIKLPDRPSSGPRLRLSPPPSLY